MNQTIKLDVAETLETQRLFALCDGKAEGFRLGMEQAKAMLVDQMIKARRIQPPPPTDEAPKE